jgi:hypothetical protein
MREFFYRTDWIGVAIAFVILSLFFTTGAAQ